MLELTLKCSECNGKYYFTQTMYDPTEADSDMRTLLKKAEDDNWVVDWENATAVCERCEDKRQRALNEIPEKIVITSYLHSDKDSNWEQLDEIEREYGFKFPEDAKENLLYMLYEVKFELEINPRTGEYKIIKTKE